MPGTVRSLSHSPSLPSTPPAQPRPELPRSASLRAPGSDSGLQPRTNSQRAASAEVTADTLPLAPRNPTLKALGKHTWGAIKHGAASGLHSASQIMHNQISSRSGPASALANAHGLASEMTQPLAKNEATTAKVHLFAARLAVKTLMGKTSKYDAGAMAQQLSWLKEQKQELQADKKTVLALGCEAPAPLAATRNTSAPAGVDPGAVMVYAHKPHASAAEAVTAAARHAVAGALHKAKAGMHLLGAKAHANQPALSQAHKMAQASHNDKAALSFGDAGVQVKHAGHYAVVSTRTLAAQGKVAGKHVLGAMHHGAASALYSTGRAAHKLTASLSGRDSLLQQAHRLAGETARPLAKTEWKMAKAHLQAARSAAGGTIDRAGTYDASAIAAKLSSLKEEKAAAQDTRKGLLGQGIVEPFSAAIPAKPSPSADASPDAATAPARTPHAPATLAASVSVRHAVMGAYHKLREGTHFLSAKALAGQPIVAQAHRQAQASHHSKAALSFDKVVAQAFSPWELRATVANPALTKPREQPSGSAEGSVPPTPTAGNQTPKQDA